MRSYAMDLSKLLDGIYQVPAVLDTLVYDIQIDSRRVKKGDLFIALSGARFPAEAHLEEAVARGANAILVEGDAHSGRVHESGDAVELYLPDLRAITARLADKFFKAPSSDISVIGVTGTNGKTSVSNYIAQLLTQNGLKTGVIGTLGCGFPDASDTMLPLERTTPDVVEVHRSLARLRDSGAKCVAMEVSSHGLEQGRVDSVRFEGAVFTNLTHDHLDYHGSMKAYGAAKAKLFVMPGLKYAVLNQSDAYARTIKEELNNKVQCFFYGESSLADVSAKELAYEQGIKATLLHGNTSVDLNSRLVGQFNLYNVLAAVSVALAKGIALEKLKGIDDIQSVPGRMDIFRRHESPTIVVDYAHTPDALENLLNAVRAHCKGKLFLVFGCGGDRDTDKRSEMAKIAERLADYIVLTDDNPRTEDPGAITDAILQGFSNTAEVSVEHDRAKAISNAVALAAERDWVVVAGKGHEDYQEIGGKRLAYSDLKQARKLVGLEVSSGSAE